MAKIERWSQKMILLGLAAFSQVLFAEPEIQVFSMKGAEKILTSERYMGEWTVVSVTGLKPNSPYRMEASMNQGPLILTSFVEGLSNSEGVFSTDEVQPTAGSYSTQGDADGLFWSMKESPNSPQSPPSKPIYTFSIFESGSLLAQKQIPLGWMKPGIKVVSLKGTGLVGTLFLPSTPAPRPVVITFSGSEGGLVTGQINAVTLANEGFAALALAYFGVKGTPQRLSAIPLEYFESAIAFLKSRPEVDAKSIAVMGASRGGELALLLGSLFPEIRAVVAQVPSLFLWPGVGEPESRGKLPAAWTWHNLAIPYMDNSFEYSSLDSYPPEDLESARIQVEKINGPVLLLAGEEDQIWPSCLFSKMTFAKLQSTHHLFRDEVYCFEDAGHNVAAIPFLPTTNTQSRHVVTGALVSLGGTPEGTARGQRLSWQKTLEFLRQTFNLSP